MRNIPLCLGGVSRLARFNAPALRARVATLLDTATVVRIGKKNKKTLLQPEQVIKTIGEKFNLPNGKIIYIGNLKGGVGKTTIAYLLIETLSALGFKTCAIDLDIQANLTRQFSYLNVDAPVFADMIDKKCTISDLIVNISPTLDLIPSSLKNSLIPRSLAVQPPKHYLKWLNALCLTYLRSEYNVIVIDTPPSLSTLNSVFCLCLNNNDNLVIPACADEFSLQGIEMFLEDVQSIRESFAAKSNPKTSIIMNKFFQNQTNNLEALSKVRKIYPEMLSKLVIKDSAKIREIVSNKMQLGETTKNHDLFEILATLLDEFSLFKDGTKHAKVR